MEYYFSLEGQAISNQSLYLQKGKIRFMKKEALQKKKRYTEEIKEQLSTSYSPIFRKGEMVELSIFLFHGDKRVRDIDNYGKILIDSMNGILFEDDRQIQVLRIEKGYDPIRPHIGIILRKYPRDD